MIPSSDLFDQSTIAALLDHDPLVQDYHAFFSLLDCPLLFPHSTDQTCDHEQFGKGKGVKRTSMTSLVVVLVCSCIAMATLSCHLRPTNLLRTHQQLGASFGH